MAPKETTCVDVELQTCVLQAQTSTSPELVQPFAISASEQFLTTTANQGDAIYFV